MKTARHTVALACLLTVMGAAPASGHGIIGRADGTLFYSAPDRAGQARLLIFSRARGSVDLLDTRSIGGVDWGPCIPITERRARCSTRGLRRIRVEVFDADDVVRSSAAVPLSVSGGSGADVIRGGYGDDVLDGGSGNDVISGGLGADRADGSEGDDVLSLREGLADTVRCDDGEDRAVLDEHDIAGFALFFDCEDRSTAPAAPDERAPRLFLRTAERQRPAPGGIAAAVALSEPGAATLRGRLFIGGRAGPLLGKATARPDAPRQRWQVRLAMGARSRNSARRALARGEPVTVGIWAAGQDRAGNRSSRMTARVRLSR